MENPEWCHQIFDVTPFLAIHISLDKSLETISKIKTGRQILIKYIFDCRFSSDMNQLLIIRSRTLYLDLNIVYRIYLQLHILTEQL